MRYAYHFSCHEETRTIVIDQSFGDPITAARKFMREKGEECLREAKRLDDLYEAARATS